MICWLLLSRQVRSERWKQGKWYSICCSPDQIKNDILLSFPKGTETWTEGQRTNHFQCCGPGTSFPCWPTNRGAWGTKKELAFENRSENTLFQEWSKWTYMPLAHILYCKYLVRLQNFPNHILIAFVSII